MSKVGKRTIAYESCPGIIASSAIVGPKEGQGPLGWCFDQVLQDDTLGQPNFEHAESELMTQTALLCIQKAGFTQAQINVMLGGDLEQQILSASLTARTLQTGFLGLYGACSTIAESMLVGSALVDAAHVDNALCITSSHFSTAEREFRMPLELGNQRTPAAQWTVTGSGAVIIAPLDKQDHRADNSKLPPLARVTHGTFGRIIDLGITDANNMGAAMAPAAADTLTTHFQDMQLSPDDYDMIATGDLGHVGQEILLELMRQRGIPIPEDKLFDCGAHMFGEEQDVHSGGSGCACLATVLSGLLLRELSHGEYKRILIMGTGALLSPVSALQGETIPCIAHALALEAI